MTRSKAFRFVAVAASINLLGYMDRVCISMLAPQLRAEFGFSAGGMGVIFGAFSLTYALFQAPWGALADRFGARRIVAGAILAWSGFTALTAAVSGFGSMLTVRLLFGVSEAAVSPSIASAFRRFVAPKHHSSAFGVFLAGGRIGGVIAPIITSTITLRYGWRPVFWIFACGGVLALAAWWWGAPEELDQSQSHLVDKPKAGLRWSPQFIALLLVAFSYTLMWQFYATWFPTYLLRGRGFSLNAAGFYTGLPFAFGLVANWLGAILSDFITARYGAGVGRKAFGFVALMSSAALLCAGLLIERPAISALLIAAAAGAGDLTLGICWARVVELGGHAAGAASGVMNSASNLAAFVSPIVIGWVYQSSANWDLVISVAAMSDVFAAIAWLLAYRDSGKRPDTVLQLMDIHTAR